MVGEAIDGAWGSGGDTIGPNDAFPIMTVCINADPFRLLLGTGIYASALTSV
jgi:hypothetical protein